jgi:hypothetical protein
MFEVLSHHEGESGIQGKEMEGITETVEYA